MEETYEPQSKNICKKIFNQIYFNSPVIIGILGISTIAIILDKITDQLSTAYLFSVYRSPFTDPLTFVRIFGHIFGHANLAHYLGNMSMLLVVGTIVEEKYGSINILIVTAITAFVTGLAHYIFYKGYVLLGASGIVFAFILLSSITGFKNNKIPVTFIIVAIFYFGQQIYEGLFVESNISNFGHIIGGVVGSAFGFVYHCYFRKRNANLEPMVDPNVNNNYGEPIILPE